MRKNSMKQRILSVVLSVAMVATSVQLNGITAKAAEGSQTETQEEIKTDWSSKTVSDATVTSVTDAVTEIIFDENVTNVNITSADALNVTKLKGITFRNPDTTINISSDINLQSVKIWCTQGSTAETFAKGRGLTAEYLNDRELSISCDNTVRYTGSDSFDVSAKTTINTTVQSVIEGVHYSNDIIWSTSDASVLCFVVDGKKYSTFDSRWLLDNANTTNQIKRAENDSTITVSLLTGKAGTATITAQSRSGKKIEVPYTVKKATDNIKISVDVYEPVITIDENGNRLINLDRLTEEESDIVSCNIKLKNTENYVFDNFDDYAQLKLDEGSYFKINYTIDEDSQDSIRTSLAGLNENFIPGGYEDVSNNDLNLSRDQVSIAGYECDGKVISKDNMYCASKQSGSVEPLIVKGISMNNNTTRIMRTYICKPCSNLTVKMDGAEVKNGNGFDKKRTDDLTMEADIGESTDYVEWRIKGDDNVASISNPDSTKTSIHINKASDFYIICEAKDFKNGTVNNSLTIHIVAIECFENDGLGFTDEARKNLVKEYRIPVDYQVKTGEKVKRVYVANVRNNNIELLNKDGKTPNETLIYTSSDTNILNIDQNGVMTTGNQTGTVTVTVQPKGRKEAAVTIPVVVYAKLQAFTPASTSIEVPVGQYRDIAISVSPDNSEEPINWQVSNSDYVKAEEYFDEKTKARYVRITGIKNSEQTQLSATGTGDVSEVKGSINVTVQEAVHADTISIANDDKNAQFISSADGPVIRIPKGRKTVLIPNLISNSGKKVNDMKQWSVKDPNNVAVCNLSADNLEITASTAGEFSIILKAYGGDFEKSAEYKVQVYVPAEKIDIVANGSTADTINVNVGTTITGIYADTTPSDTTDKIKWSVDTEGIIQLSKNETTSADKILAFSALKTGIVTLTATSESGAVDTVKINVIKPADAINFVKDGQTIRDTIYINPNVPTTIGIEVIGDGTTDVSGFTWSKIEEKGILSIATPAEDKDKKTLVLTGTAPGTQTISVSAPSGVSASINVVIVQPATSIGLNASALTVVKGDEPVNIYATLSPSNTTDHVTWSVPESEEGIISWTEYDDSTTTNTQKHITVSAVKAGTAHLTATTVSGKTATIVITSVARDMTSSDTTVQVGDMEYTGAELKPYVYVYYKNNQLSENVDYTLEYTNNVAAGKGKVKITGIGNYSGEIEKEFNITQRNIAGVQIEAIAECVYSGKELTPEFVVTDSATGSAVVLTKDVDYSVKYNNNINVGYATVELTGIGNYTGTTSGSYSIIPKSMSSADITVSGIKDVTYNFNYQEQKITVKDGTKELADGTDYNVSYENNYSAGTATLTINGSGNYSDSVIKTFTIKKKSLSSAKITGLENVIYTGKSIKMNYLSVNMGNNSLSSGTDYTVKYSGNKNPGKATVKITGKGNFTGSKTVYFIIYPKTPKSGKMSSTATTSLKLTWSKSTGASGYVISVFNAKKNKYVKVATSTKNYVTLKKLTPGTVYQYSVSPYVKSGSKTYASKESITITAGTSVSPVKIKKIKSSYQDLTVTYSKAKNADGYAIYTSTKKNGKYKLAVTSSEASAYISGLKSRKTIYVKIKSYKNINGKNYYSAFSSVKSVKIK